MWDDLWTGLKWIAKTCFAFAVVALALLPLLVMLDFDGRVPPMMIPAGLSQSWLALVLLALSLFLIYLAWRLLRALLLRPLGSWEVFGATAGARLIALGITAIFLPRAVEKLLLFAPTILLRLVDSLGRRANILSESSAPPEDALVNIQAPVMRMASMVPELLSETARIVSAAFEGVLAADMVVALAIWIMIGKLLSAAVDEHALAAGQGSSRLTHLVNTMTPAQRHGAVLTAVFLLGTYLSIAAIVAIPWLHEEKVSPGLTQESLVKMLASVLPAPVAPAPRGEHPADDPLVPLNDLLSDPAKLQQLPPAFAASLKAAIGEAANARARALLRLQQMPGEMTQRIAQMRQAATNAFELETSTLMSNQERGLFMRQIQQTILSEFRRLENEQQQCANALSDADSQLRAIGQTAVQVLAFTGTQAQASLREVADESRVLILREVRSTAMHMDTVTRSLCDALDLQHTVYTPPAAGTGWGPFGVVARWLLQTKSMALTLITGMLGFGLLGSAIATFVRSKPGSGNTSLTAEFTSLVVRGLSAAVVVFLAVKGGLAVFSSGDAEPNAYVVFLTCLVGAVFSEDVWTWARNKFLENFQHGGSDAVRSQTMAEAIEERSPGQAVQPQPPIGEMENPRPGRP